MHLIGPVPLTLQMRWRYPTVTMGIVKTLVRPLSISLLALLLAPSAQAQSIALVGGTVIDGTGKSRSDATVIVTGDRIACIGTAADCPVPAGATRVDATGRFITPGLVDAHVHFSQTGWVDGRPDGLPAPAI
jgi:hypothetical protein